jgi:steroid delta-isomerase-like uncharacterized protein
MSTTSAPATVTELIGDYVAAWEARDPDRIASLHTEDGVFHLHSAGEPVRGREAIRDAFAGFLAQFPDLTFVEQELQSADWGWAVRWTMSGTLAQPFEVGDAVAEPGARFEIDAIDMITVSGGLVAAKHTYLDWQSGLAQLGLA